VCVLKSTSGLIPSGLKRSMIVSAKSFNYIPSALYMRLTISYKSEMLSTGIVQSHHFVSSIQWMNEP
jgi:hypothetical protein